MTIQLPTETDQEKVARLTTRLTQTSEDMEKACLTLTSERDRTRELLTRTQACLLRVEAGAKLQRLELDEANRNLATAREELRGLREQVDTNAEVIRDFETANRMLKTTVDMLTADNRALKVRLFDGLSAQLLTDDDKARAYDAITRR